MQTNKPRFSLPENAADAFFDYPSDERRDALCAARMFERYKDNWRVQRSQVSCASSPDNEQINDPLPGAVGDKVRMTVIYPDGFSESFAIQTVPTGAARASHDLLISASFGFHPDFGTGHVLRTNGVICMFWNGEEVAIVELKNVTKLPILLAGERKSKTSERAKRLVSAMLED